MRIAIPMAAVLLVGIAAGIHPVFVGPASPGRRFPGPSEPNAPASETLRLEEPTRAVRVQAQASPDPKGKAPEPLAAIRKVPEGPWRKLSQVLAGELKLTSMQQGTVDQVLRERQEEIRTCHEEIRKARLLDMRHYEWQVGRMKESWYRRIDALLDAAQHERFVAVAEQGFFNDGLGFTEDPGMTVLD